MKNPEEQPDEEEILDEEERDFLTSALSELVGKDLSKSKDSDIKREGDR